MLECGMWVRVSEHWTGWGAHIHTTRFHCRVWCQDMERAGGEPPLALCSGSQQPAWEPIWVVCPQRFQWLECTTEVWGWQTGSASQSWRGRGVWGRESALWLLGCGCCVSCELQESCFPDAGRRSWILGACWLPLGRQ